MSRFDPTTDINRALHNVIRAYHNITTTPTRNRPPSDDFDTLPQRFTTLWAALDELQQITGIQPTASTDPNDPTTHNTTCQGRPCSCTRYPHTHIHPTDCTCR